MKVPNLKNQQQIENADVNSNISENKKKNNMTRVKLNKRIELFSLWYFNQSEAGKKYINICFTKRKIFNDSQSIIKSTNFP